ncbi:hypothetical protein A2995_01015 [Candidatus Nomurabacteria bacterium RIFCSPLOWO2_01_FULL_33_24]|uniref:Uncharacterized protein n=1 Tax=Candidatus Nomurabacteria bacterium RIFCSPLOWO2_01_FULL_33_24 TaxID=1801765 RepID=A0A1F6WZQ9_9BACT|nr:MAG: hypothetical protein A2995_01015 [Candidatus Nomurabacteria bacterium RIFCSPLOWO2_01_FULL_33_24]
MNENINTGEQNSPNNEIFTKSRNKKNGSPIGIIIIVIILVIGGFFLLKDENEKNIPKNEEAIVDQVEEISTQTIDNELTALEDELNLDAELQVIEDDLSDLNNINLDNLDLGL